MKINLKNGKKEFAQGLVEFALAVPIFLTVALGLLEVGRVLFIYSSVVTASREAVRYGSVTGVNDGGIPFFQDCVGIRTAARNVGFLSDFQDSDISIQFDTGPGTSTFATCDGVDFVALQPRNGDRLLVSIETDFLPIIPLVPMDPFTIQSSSSRTMLVDIALESTLVAGEWELETPTATLTATPTNTNTPTATNTFTPTPLNSPTPSNTPEPTNTPTITFTPTITNTPTATGTATNTPAPTGTPIACFISHDGLAVVKEKMLLTVHNDSNYPVTISEITIFYNASSPAGQKLTTVYADGVLVWDQDITGSPVTLTNFLEPVTIDPWSSVALKVFFNKNLKVNGAENMMISFIENGCPIHGTE